MASLVRRLRSDLGRFDAEALGDGEPMEPWQVEALSVHERSERETAVLGPRRSGKSRGAAKLGLFWTARRPEEEAVIFSSTEEGAKRLLATAAKLADRSPLLAGSVVDGQAHKLTLSNGSVLRCVAATEAAIRGWGPSLVVADEAALIKDSALEAARPLIADREHGRLVLISSAVRAGGYFFDAIRRGEAGARGTRAFRWSLSDCWWISPTDVEQARESMSPTRFAAEYEGAFSSGADALFTPQGLDAATADYRPLELGQLEGPARVTAGQDWGQTTDRSALVALARLPVPGERAFGVVCAKRWPAGYPLHEVVEEVCASPGHFAYFAGEANGLGGPLAGADHGLLWRRMAARPQEAGGGRSPRRLVIVEERPWSPNFGNSRQRVERRRGFCTQKVAVNVSAEQKAATYSALRLLVDQGRLLIPAEAEELRRELLVLRVDLNPSGTEKIEASSGHDDLADALALSLIPYRTEGGWRTLIASLADPRRPLPDPEPALPGGLATVSAGCGLEVPVGPGRVPIFQSVKGPELTGVEPAEDPSEQRSDEGAFGGITMRRMPPVP